MAVHFTFASFIHARFVRLVLSFLLLMSPLLGWGQSSTIVISQVYGGGGNAGAPFTNDFVELYNKSASAVSINGWSLQYGAAGAGNTNTTIVSPLNGSIQPNSYYLVRLAGGTIGTPITNQDANSGTNISATGGKVALASDATPVTGPTAPNVIDYVGYGTNVGTPAEGGNRAPAGSNTTAVIRANNGCNDTNDNGADFGAGTPNPRTTASPTFSCGVNPTPTITSFTPASGTIGTTVTINGANFASGASVQFNTTAATNVTFVSATQLTAFVPTGATTGPIFVTVAGNTATSATSFVVDPNPAPVISSLMPNTLAAGSNAFTLVVSGTGFAPGSIVSFNGSQRPTTFTSTTQLSAAIPATDIINTGSYNVVVTNPTPGGGASAPATFTVTAPVVSAVLLAYNFTANELPSTQASNVMGSPYGRSAGVATATATGAFSSNGWTQNNTIDAGDYHTFILTINTGYKATLTSLAFDEQRSNTGPTEFELRSSLDNYASVIYAGNTNEMLDNEQITLSSAFASLQGTVAFRLYAYSSSGGSGTWRQDNVQLSGTVALLTPEIDINQGTTSIVSGATYSGFAPVNVGNTDTKTFTITNTGDSNLTLGGFVITGDYTLVNGTAPTSLPAGGSVTFDIQFAPTNPMNTTGSVSIQNNDVTDNESPFIITLQPSGPLPVELISFTAERQANAIQLAWATASEKDNAYFEVQRSATGREFATIATVKGQGTSTRRHTYSTLDSQPLDGVAYYRLRQVDFDGTASFSPVVTVAVSGKELTLHPNPAQGELHWVASAGGTHYRVVNSVGRLVLEGNADGAATLNTSALPAGLYQLELTTGGSRIVRKFIKE